MGIVTTLSSLLVLVMIATTANARVINKRAAFYIANDTMCIVDGELYFNGDPVPTDDHCEKCTCRPPGFSCVLRDCEVKPGCKAVRKDGECCPDYICGCSHNGNVYKDGDFIRDLQNPCYTCRCHGSSISCTFADCLFRSDCGPEYMQGECCPRYDHCPPLSTTQKSTTVITTVPITYDETTKPLFNLTSPPHERLATHTTIFPTTGMITTEDGETHTTETYAKPAISHVSTEATPTTRGHQFTEVHSAESSTSRITQDDTSTVTTSSPKIATEMLSVIDKDSSQKPVSLSDETSSTESFSTVTFLSTDAKTDTETKDLTSTPITAELSSEGDLLPEDLQDGQTTDVSHDRQTEEPSTHDRHTGESVTDRYTNEVVTEISDDNRIDQLITEVTQDDPETKFSTGKHTAESVTEVSYDKETNELVTESAHGVEIKVDHTTPGSDETVSVTFSEEISRSTSDDTEEDESKGITQSVDDIVETTTEIRTTHEELEVSAEDEVQSTHEIFSSQPEVVAESESTSPSLVDVVTMSGETDTVQPSVKVFTTTETHDFATHDTHRYPTVSDASTSEAQKTSAHEIHEDVTDTSLPAAASQYDHQTKSDAEDKTTMSTQESEFGDSEFSTVQSEAKSHSLSTESADADVSTDELSTNEGEISTQDAEEVNLFTVAVTPSSGSQSSATTILDHISHLPSSEETYTQTVTDELAEEQSVDASKVTEDDLETEDIGSISSDVDKISSFDESFHPVQRTTAQSVEVSHSPQHSHFVLHSHETTTSESAYTSSDIQSETTISDHSHNESVKEFLPSEFAEDVPENNSGASQNATESLPDQVHALNEVVVEENVGTALSSSDDHDAPNLLSEGVNALSPTDEHDTERDQIHAETEEASESSVTVATEGTTETVITMEAESDLSLTTSQDGSTTPADDDVSITPPKATEPSEGLSVISESLTTTRIVETPATLISLSEVSSTAVRETTAEHITDDVLTIKPKEHELLSEKPHLTSTLPPQQETSVFNKNSDIALSTTRTPSDDLNHSEQTEEASSTISKTNDKVTSESVTSTASDHSSRSTVTATSLEESNEGSGNGISLTTSSIATESSESPTASPKHFAEDTKPTNEYDSDESTASSAHFIKAEEQNNSENESSSVNEFITDSQQNIGSHITEDTSEITMDAEESVVHNGFESISDYPHTTENYEDNFVFTTQARTSVDKEDNDAHDHYIVDDETYGAQSGEHLRVSRSTSSNSIASSITAQYPEKTELKTVHISEAENETRGALTTNGISVTSFGSTVVAGNDKSVTESLNSDVTETTPSSVGDNDSKSTHSAYLNSVEGSSLSSDPSIENLVTSPNTDDSYVSQITKLIFESGRPSEDNLGLKIDETEETYEDRLNEELPLASTSEIFPNAEPTNGLLKDYIAPDLIIPVEHHVNEIPFNSAETESSILSDHSTNAPKEHVSNPSMTITPTIMSSTSDLKSSETHNVHSSESNDKNEAAEREDNDDLISPFSRASEKYATDETFVDNEAFTSTTENQQTLSSFMMDAEAETYYLDDSTDGRNNKEYSEDQSVTNSPSSGPTSAFESRTSQKTSTSEEEELVGKEFQDGPEKGGEWFEPTIPVLSAINVNKASDKTMTSTDIPTVTTSTDFKEAVTVKHQETFLATDLVDQTQKKIDNTPSSTFMENQHRRPPTAILNVRYFIKNHGDEVVDTTSAKETSSPTSASYEATHLGATDDLEYHTNRHQFFYSSEPETILNFNIPTTGEPQENDADTIVSTKLTSAAEENGSDSETLNVAKSSEDEEIDEKENEEGNFPEQTAVNEVTHEHTTKLVQSGDNIQTITTETNSISQTEKVESTPVSDVEHRSTLKNAELREQKEIKDEPGNSSEHEIDNVISETEKEAGISPNEIMLSDGVGSVMRFTDAVTDSSDLIMDRISTTESGTVHENLGKGFESTSSQREEFYSNPEPVTNDEVLYVKGSEEKNVSEESTTTEENSSGLTESEKSSEVTMDRGHTFEKSTENSVVFRDNTEGLQHKNDEDYTTEGFSTSHYKLTTPLPLLLFNEFVEKVKEDSLSNRISQSGEEQDSTIQPEEISEVFSESVPDEKTEDLEKQSHDDSETGVINDHETTTTQRNNNEHASVFTTPNTQEKQTEIFSTSTHSIEFTSQNSYPTANTYSDHSLEETEEVTDSIASSHVTEQNTKPEKNVSRVFFIRRSHDDDPSEKDNSQKKEEYTGEKDGVVYSIKSPEIAVKNPDETNQEEHDKVSVTTEETTKEQDEGSTDDTHQKDFHDSDLDTTSTSRRSVEPTSTVSTKVEHATASSSADETFHSESTEVAQNNEDELLKEERDNISGPETTSDPMNSDITSNF